MFDWHCVDVTCSYFAGVLGNKDSSAKVNNLVTNLTFNVIYTSFELM